MEIDYKEWADKINEPYDTEAKLIEVQGKYLEAMTERLDEIQFILEAKNTDVGEMYRQVLLEHIDFALKGVSFGQEREFRRLEAIRNREEFKKNPVPGIHTNISFRGYLKAQEELGDM